MRQKASVPFTNSAQYRLNRKNVNRRSPQTLYWYTIRHNNNKNKNNNNDNSSSSSSGGGGGGSSSSGSAAAALYLWFHASLIYINNCPTRCNTKQSIYYSASSLYMLRVSATPIIRLAWPRWRQVAAQKIWPVPEAVVTVLCGWHTKHAEWTCRIINRLLCVACRWTIINIQQQQQFRQLKQTLENGWI